jgi:hypothetical protein
VAIRPTANRHAFTPPRVPDYNSGRFRSGISFLFFAGSSMRLRAGTVLPLFFVVCAPALAFGQQNLAFAFNETASTITLAPPVILQEPNVEKPEEVMSTSGFFLGIIGMLGGAAVGGSVGAGDCPSRTVDKECMSRHAYTGALIAGTLMVPIGVHIANNHRRNLPLSMATSAALGAAMYYGMKAIPGSPIGMAPFISAPLQVVTSVRIERRK